MANCTIKFSDNTETNQIDISVDFDPDLENPLHGHEPTPAQNMGWQFAQSLMGDSNTADQAER